MKVIVAETIEQLRDADALRFSAFKGTGKFEEKAFFIEHRDLYLPVLVAYDQNEKAVGTVRLLLNESLNRYECQMLAVPHSGKMPFKVLLSLYWRVAQICREKGVPLLFANTNIETVGMWGKLGARKQGKSIYLDEVGDWAQPMTLSVDVLETKLKKLLKK